MNFKKTLASIAAGAIAVSSMAVAVAAETETKQIDLDIYSTDGIYTPKASFSWDLGKDFYFVNTPGTSTETEAVVENPYYNNAPVAPLKVGDDITKFKDSQGNAYTLDDPTPSTGTPSTVYADNFMFDIILEADNKTVKSIGAKDVVVSSKYLAVDDIRDVTAANCVLKTTSTGTGAFTNVAAYANKAAVEIEYTNKIFVTLPEYIEMKAGDDKYYFAVDLSTAKINDQKLKPQAESQEVRFYDFGAPYNSDSSWKTLSGGYQVPVSNDGAPLTHIRRDTDNITITFELKDIGSGKTINGKDIEELADHEEEIQDYSVSTPSASQLNIVFGDPSAKLYLGEVGTQDKITEVTRFRYDTNYKAESKKNISSKKDGAKTTNARIRLTAEEKELIENGATATIYVETKSTSSTRQYVDVTVQDHYGDDVKSYGTSIKARGTETLVFDNVNLYDSKYDEVYAEFEINADGSYITFSDAYLELSYEVAAETEATTEVAPPVEVEVPGGEPAEIEDPIADITTPAVDTEPVVTVTEPAPVVTEPAVSSEAPAASQPATQVPGGNDANPATGVGLAAIPAALAGLGALIARKRK